MRTRAHDKRRPKARVHRRKAWTLLELRKLAKEYGTVDVLNELAAYGSRLRVHV